MPTAKTADEMVDALEFATRKLQPSVRVEFIKKLRDLIGNGDEFEFDVSPEGKAIIRVDGTIVFP